MAKKPAAKKEKAADPEVGLERIGGKLWNVLSECHEGMVLATRATDAPPATVYCVKRD